MSNDLICYPFSREKVERGNFGHCLGLYGPNRLPAGRRLRKMMNDMVFGIEGYDDDPREVHSVPKIHRFYAAIHNAWPYWLYFCDLDTEGLRVIVLCCLPSLMAMKVDGHPQVAVEYNPLDLFEFLRVDFMLMNSLCERLIYDRTQALSNISTCCSMWGRPGENGMETKYRRATLMLSASN